MLEENESPLPQQPLPQMPPMPRMPQAAVGRVATSPLLIPASILIGAVIIGAFLMVGLSHGGSTSGSNAAGAAATTQAVNISDVKTAGEPYIGNANAPVTMAYWSDYQCPFCKAFEVGGVPQINSTTPAAMPDLIKEYVDTGKLKIVFKDFPFLGNDSITASEYARAIWDLYPAQFYDWRVAMYKAQDEEGDQGFGNAATIDQLIESQFPQMSDTKIQAQIVAKKAQYDAAMQADRAEGESFGIQGTPGFIIGTTLIPGAAPLATFTAAIDPLLK